MRKRILELMPVLACLTLVLATAGAAHATFPGRNGLIAFQAQATPDAHIEIYTVRQNGHDLRQITNLDADAVTPDWSPDGRQIVFEIDRPEAPFCSIALMNRDGSNIVELTPNEFVLRAGSVVHAKRVTDRVQPLRRCRRGVLEYGSQWQRSATDWPLLR